jgi:regulator of protease activity HflC (stomatin/prohibitin superfamily)
VRAIQERAALNNDFDTAVTSAINDGPINIISVQIENIDFSDAYEQSVEQRMLAQVEIQKREQNLRTTEVEAQIARTKAEGEAEATRLRGEAEASAIRARADALRANTDPRAAASRREVGRQVADDDGAELRDAVHQRAAGPRATSTANLENP